VTAYAKEEINAINELKSLSVTGILYKPFDPEQLLTALSSLTLKK
jgi:DNA-binding NarL/FixJ family response regulator